MKRTGDFFEIKIKSVGGYIFNIIPQFSAAWSRKYEYIHTIFQIWDSRKDKISLAGACEAIL